MTSQDLTQDFLSCVQRLQSEGYGASTAGGGRAMAGGGTVDGSGIGVGISHRHSPMRPTTAAAAAQAGTAAHTSQFTAGVAQVAKDLGAASSKLSALTQLVRTKSTFNDRTREINRLTLSLKDDITTLNGRLDELSNMIPARPNMRDQSSIHTLSMVGTLKSQLAMTAKSFKDVLKVRSETLTATKQRKARFGRERSLGRPMSFSSPGRRQGAGTGAGQGRGQDPASASLLPRPDGLATPTHDAGQAPEALFSPVEAQDLMPVTEYYDDRARDMQNLHTHIVDLGNLFHKLSFMVSEQSQMVTRVSDNLDSTLDHAERGTNELTKKLASVSSNKKLMLSIFGIVLAFFIFFSIFLA